MKFINAEHYAHAAKLQRQNARLHSEDVELFTASSI